MWLYMNEYMESAVCLDCRLVWSSKSLFFFILLLFTPLLVHRVYGPVDQAGLCACMCQYSVQLTKEMSEANLAIIGLFWMSSHPTILALLLLLSFYFSWALSQENLFTLTQQVASSGSEQLSPCMKKVCNSLSVCLRLAAKRSKFLFTPMLKRPTLEER